MIFMTHPKHGAMLVRSAAESIEHQKNGWKKSTTAEWLGDKAVTPDEVSDLSDAPKKRGRPAKAE